MAIYEHDLAHIQASAFRDFAAGATSALIARLRDASTPVHRVVDVGCGAGVSTRVFRHARLHLVPIEPSTALLEIARNTGPAARFRHASAYEAEMPPCEAILAIGEPLRPPNVATCL